MRCIVDNPKIKNAFFYKKIRHSACSDTTFTCRFRPVLSTAPRPAEAAARALPGTFARASSASAADGNPADIDAAPHRLHGAEQRPPPLIQSTIRRLLRDILTGVYGPGDRIREAEVAERFGISRAPVREALRVLEQDGLVVMAPFRGASVIDPGPEEIADLFDLLGTVYGAMARFAVRHSSDADLQRFSADVALFTRAAAEGCDSFYLVDIAYRAGTDLGESCGSPIAADMMQRLGRVAYWLHRYLLPVPRRWQLQGATKFRRLEQALQARSEEKSEAAARKLVQHTRELLVQHALAAQARTALSTRKPPQRRSP